MTRFVSRERGGVSPVSALIYGATADVVLLAVLVVIVADASHGIVVALIGLLSVTTVLAYRATRRHLSRRPHPPNTS